MSTRAPSASLGETLWRAAPVLACISIVGMALGLLSPLLSLRMERAGAASSAIGLLGAVTAIATTFTGPLVPRFTRLVGGRRLLILAIIGALILLPSFQLVDDWAYWYPLRFLLSFMLTILFVATEILINAVTSDRLRGQVLGIYTAVLSGGWMLGPIVLTIVGIDGAMPFIVGTVLIALAAIPVIALGAGLPSASQHATVPMWSIVARSPATFAAGFAYGAIEVSFFGLMPIYGLAVGMDVPMIGRLLSVTAFGQVVLQVPIGMLADRFDRRLVLICCGLIGIAGMAALIWLKDQPVPLAAALFVWGGIVVGFYTIGLTILGERHQGAELTTANAAFASAYGVGALVGPTLCGYAMDRWPIEGLPVTLAIIASLALLLVIRRWLGEPRLYRVRPQPLPNPTS